MGSEQLLDDIQDVNLSYLLLIQRLINTDRELARFRLKIDDDMADLLGTIPIADLSRLAKCNQLLCHFSLESAEELYALINSSKSDEFLQTHAALLLASRDNNKSDRRRRGAQAGGRRRDEHAS